MALDYHKQAGQGREGSSRLFIHPDTEQQCTQHGYSAADPEGFHRPEIDGLRIHYIPHTLEHCSSAMLAPITNADIEEYKNIKHPGALNRSLMTRATLRRALSDEVNHTIAPERWAFVRNKNGRPDLKTSHPQLSFNCSHADGLSIVVVSTKGAVGADLVSVDRDMDLSLAEMFLSPGEIRSLDDASRPPFEKRQAFCRYWAVKEACLKLNGDALSEQIKEIELDPVEDQLNALPAGNTSYSQVRLITRHLSVLEGKYSAAIAVGSA